MSGDRMENEETAIAVLITENGARNICVDAREKSPYTHEALGGTPTFLGSWEECIYLLGRVEPDTSVAPVNEDLRPATHREDGPLYPSFSHKAERGLCSHRFTQDDLVSLCQDFQ